MIDPYILGLFLIGLVLLTVSWGSEWISHLPLSYSIVYLIIGVLLGPYGIDLIKLQPDTEFLERFSEFVVLVSLYNCGLKINRPLTLARWSAPIRLVGLLQPLSIFAIAALAHWLFAMSWGAAVLLGAILSPTDPVLASEVQLENPDDVNELRFGLTSEGGINDALAFPFVYLGLHWIEDPNLGNWFTQWVLIDLFWAIAAAFAVGIATARAGVLINRWIQKAKGLNDVMADVIAIGFILVTYSLTEIINGYGFLAVFVTGYVVKMYGYYPEQRESELLFVTRIEKLLEVGAILLLGALLRTEQIQDYGLEALIIGGLLLFVIRPVGAWICTIGNRFHHATRLLFGWFGIRGIGSIYYLSYAVTQGLPGPVLAELRWVVYLTVITSILLHGITATPLVNWHDQKTGDGDCSDGHS